MGTARNDAKNARNEGVFEPKRIEGIEYDPQISVNTSKKYMLRMLRNANAKSVIGRLPEPGEEQLIVMTGTFHGLDVVEAILDLAGCPAVEVYLATLGTNQANIDTIADLIDNAKIAKVTMLVAEAFRERNQKEHAYLVDMMESRGQRLAVSRNHAKLMLLRFADGRYISVHGSLNLRRCNSFEQIAISSDPELYLFFAGFIEEIIRGLPA